MQNPIGEADSHGFCIRNCEGTEQLRKDFKRHKDAVAYFNQNYVAKEIFPKSIGKALGRLKRKREASDYDDFYVASYEETMEQLEYAKEIVTEIKKYVSNI